MTDYDQIAQGCVSPVLLAAINERKEQYIYEGYVRWGLVERHIIEHVAAALRAAHAAGVAERCAVGWDTLVCINCSHVGEPPPPPALSCCPERKTVAFGELAGGYKAGMATERGRCAEIAEAARCGIILGDQKKCGLRHVASIAAAIRKEE